MKSIGLLFCLLLTGVPAQAQTVQDIDQRRAALVEHERQVDDVRDAVQARVVAPPPRRVPRLSPRKLLR